MLVPKKNKKHSMLDIGLLKRTKLEPIESKEDALEQQNTTAPISSAGPDSTDNSFISDQQHRADLSLSVVGSLKDISIRKRLASIST
jgi:hypothetical protein